MDELPATLPWSDFLLACWPVWFLLGALLVLRLCGVRL